ncbi:unnamed protein product [Cyclocybe aegerita]|uniref:Hydrophobin n=1 Tax=Cyclocybe aegerita TaxID=1973307 RepID=A0A8S0X0P7_CYCAE|nr:unnamed protein product [Cyclocybe aegerita]
MFSKIALLTAAAMSVFVAASPAPDGSEGGIHNSCNTGPVQCCNSLYENESEQANLLISLVGAVVGPIGTQVGANCSPLSVIGVGSGASCNTQPVCCSNNKFNGLVAIGCSPINVNL